MVKLVSSILFGWCSLSVIFFSGDGLDWDNILAIRSIVC